MLLYSLVIMDSDQINMGFYGNYFSLGVLLSCGLLLGGLVGCIPPLEEEEESPIPEVAPVAPELSQPIHEDDLDKPFSVTSWGDERDYLRSSEFHGKVVLVDFWATWSEPCRESALMLDTLYQDFKGQDFVVIGMTLDLGAKSSILHNLNELGITYPMGMASDRVKRDYGGIRVMPTKFVFDHEGRLAKTYVGFIKKDELKEDITTLLQRM